MSKQVLALLAVAILATAVIPAGAQQTQPGSQPAGTGPLMREFMGVNTNALYFRPQLYNKVCRLVRDYHNPRWDFVEGSTSELRGFENAYRDETDMNWNELYTAMKHAGMAVEASIQFYNLLPDDWEDMERDAYAYGKAFAEYFGPNGEDLLFAAEVGNEPSGYNGEQYMRLFDAMARGLRDGDPDLLIATCNVQLNPDTWSHDLEMFADRGELYDVINTHVYALKTGWPTWERSYPEDPSIDYLQKIRDITAWRDANAPDKELWITEFGWDASTHPAPEEGTFRRFMDHSDVQQAQYLVRSFLLFSAMGVDKAMMFYYNDEDQPRLHASSGLTRNFHPKASFFAMQHLFDTLGDYRFSRAVTEREGELYVYEYVHGQDDGKVIWVAWSPTATEKRVDTNIALPARPFQAYRMPENGGGPVAMPIFALPEAQSGEFSFGIDGSPIYIHMNLAE